MEKIKVGIVGLGCLGKEYVKNLIYCIFLVDLIVVCSISGEELEFVRMELEILYLFEDFDEMF